MGKRTLEGLIFNIQRYCVHDGPGIRTIVFLNGCPLNCLWCQNPEGQLMKPQVFLYKDRCIGCGKCISACPRGAIELYEGRSRTNRGLCIGCGKCSEVCLNEARSLVGRWVSAEEVFEEIKKDSIFYERSGGGITLSGGEPLVQAEFATAVLKLCKKEHMHTAIETSGHAPWETMKKVLEHVDLVLYDFKHMDPTKHKEYTGVSNTQILMNAKRICRELRVPLWARIPVIPGYNDSIENIDATAKFIAYELGEVVEQVNLLPYHKLGETKYERLERKCLVSIKAPDDEHMLKLQKIFETFGIKTRLGG